uniref:Nebulin n=1 Tax=Haplochromis burtoni TaxID=8153 RepID=A0A3Q2WA58_HAPBU
MMHQPHNNKYFIMKSLIMQNFKINAGETVKQNAFLKDVLMWSASVDVVHVFVSQKAYREESKKEAGCSLYAQMPQTIETVFAKELSKTQSDKLYKEKYNREKGKSSYTNMKTLPEVEHAMEVNKKQSEVSYRKGKEELHHYNTIPDRPDIVNATNAAKLASDVTYKSNTKQPVYSDESLLARTDIQHAKEVSKLASQVTHSLPSMH